MDKQQTPKLRVNRARLPIKILYFSFGGGTAAVLPFVPVIAKSLGISTWALGLIFACLPIISVVIVATVSGLADRYRLHKSLLVSTFTVTALTVLSLRFVPHVGLPSNTSLLDGTRSRSCHRQEESGYGRLTICGLEDGNGSSSSPYPVEDTVCDVSCGSTSICAIKTSVGGRDVSPRDPTKYFPVPAPKGCLVLLTNLTWDEECQQETTLINCTLTCNGSSGASSDLVVFKSPAFWMFTLCICVCFCGGQVIFTFLDTVAYSILGDKRHLYGRQRLWAGIGWGTVAIATGQIIDTVSEGSGRFDYGPGSYILAAFYLVGVATTAVAPWKPQPKPKNIGGNLKVLFREPRVLLLMATAVIAGALASVFGNFLFWYLEDLESSRLLLGLCLAVNSCAEVLVFVFSGKITSKMGFANSIGLVFAAFALRFLALSAIDNPYYALPIETLHGVTFALFYHCLTSMASCYASPGMAATTQSILGGAYRQIGFALGSVCGGLLFKVFGGRMTFRYLGFLSLALGILHFGLHRLLAQTSRAAQRQEPNSVSTENPNKIPNRYNELDANVVSELDAIAADNTVDSDKVQNSLKETCPE